MARTATGQIIERPGKDGRVYRSLRFYAYGQRQRRSLGPVTHDEAKRELRGILADIERGVWTPPEPTSEPPTMPTFHAYAEEWWLRNAPRLSDGTQADYRGRLERQLIPYFGPLALHAITFDTVETYIAGKLAGVVYEDGREKGKGRPLSPRSVNMTLVLLAAVLETAVERDLIRRNPAKGRGRRVRERKPTRTYLEAPEQIEALRRTFASLLYAVGESPVVVMQEMGHADEGLALRVYAQAMRRDEGEREQLRALIEGPEWANVGQRATGAPAETVEDEAT